MLDGNMSRLVAAWPVTAAAAAAPGGTWPMTEAELEATKSGRSHWVADSTADRLAMANGNASHLDVPISGRVPGFVTFGCAEPDGLSAAARDLIEQTAQDVGPWLLIHAAQDAAVTSAQIAQATSEALRKLAHTDALTGLANRRVWDEEILSRASPELRSRLPLAVAVLDMDHFKDFNDQRGHPAGDELLSQVAGAWSGKLRGGDLLARIGGEEFGLLLDGCALDDARRVLRGLLDAVPLQQTASAGVTCVRPGEVPSAAIARADRALYAAKAAGRDLAVGEP
jgi:diguanylate cyclase (GGDEF)-like protein